MMTGIDYNKLDLYTDIAKECTIETAYELLQMAKVKKVAPEAVIALKRRVRSINKEETKSGKIIYDYGNGGYDGYIYKEVLEVNSMEEAEEEFEEYHRRTYIERGYDCTGQAFTQWHKIFNINGRFVLYHSVGFDV